MSAMSDAQSLADAAEVLRSIHRKRVRFWSENGKLHYRAPKGVLTPEELAKLRTLSEQIAALLEQSGTAPASLPRLEARQERERVPLTHAQLSYWQSSRLGERPAFRSVVAAKKVLGRLDTGLLRECVAEIVRRHEALRTRVVTDGGIPEQRILKSCAYELRTHDLGQLPQSDHDAEAQRRIHEMVLEPIRVETGPLFAVNLIRLRPDAHVLMVAMEHIVSDGFSLNVFWRELIAAYSQAAQGQALSLPAIPIQFADYAVWQSKAHAAWVRHYSSDWRQRFAGCARLNFPDPDAVAPSGVSKSLLLLPILIGADVRAALTEWCRPRRTTIAMAAFTAFVALVLRFCRAEEGVLGLQSDGRFSPLVEHSVGYFACALSLRVELRERDSFIDLLARVMSEYCTASEYGDLAYLDSELAPCAGNCAFNWIPELVGAAPEARSGPEQVAFEPFRYELPDNDRIEYEQEFAPCITLFDSGTMVRGHVLYAPSRNSARTVEAFRDSFLTLIGELLRAPEQRVCSIPLRLP
jgi:condensation domain-containing protein/tubulysin polyketide synthase-like protein